MTWLSKLKEGDDVAISGSHGVLSLAVVSKVTATQIVVGNNRFRRKDGYRLGDSGPWNRLRLREPTIQIREALELSELRMKIARYAESTTSSLPVLRKMRNCLYD